MTPIRFPQIASTYDEYLDSLYSYALHLGFDDQTAMDAIHDVFFKLCIHHSSLSEITNLKFYLFRALRNRLIDIERGKKAYTDISHMEDNISEILPFQLNVNIEEELIMKEDSEEIRRIVENVLNRLTDRQREIIYLRFFQEYSYEEIADIMKISVESSRNLISKSLSRLKGSDLSLYFLLMFIL